jgi:hypothetical protein
MEFFLRTLILICILSMAFGTYPHIHPGLRGAWAISAFLLLIIALSRWKSDGVLYRIGFVLGALGFLAALLFPEISTTQRHGFGIKRLRDLPQAGTLTEQ